MCLDWAWRRGEGGKKIEEGQRERGEDMEERRGSERDRGGTETF